MPHTRRARELGLSQVTIGNWNQKNERFKLRLCWGEQCIALCLGENGMVETRISLDNIALINNEDGAITLKMVPGFPRKFFGHTANNHNSLREIRQDPSGGALDLHRTATCYVRGGDPVKLAKDFVVRVEKFREEVNKPEPDLDVDPRTVTSTAPLVVENNVNVAPSLIPTAPLGPRNINSPGWRRPVNNGMPFAANVTFNVNRPTMQPSHNALVQPTMPLQMSVQQRQNWQPANVRFREQPINQGTLPFRTHQRDSENAQAPRARFYAPPPTPAESEGQSEHLQLKVDQILPTLVRKASKNRLPLRSENPSANNLSSIAEVRGQSPMAALLKDSIPEPASVESQIDRQNRRLGLGHVDLGYMRPGVQNDFYYTPQMYSGPIREPRLTNQPPIYNTPKSGSSSFMSGTPSPVTSSLDTSIGSTDLSPPGSPFGGSVEGLDPSAWEFRKVFAHSIQPTCLQLPYMPMSRPRPVSNAATQTHNKYVVLRHKGDVQGKKEDSISLRTAPISYPFNWILIFAAYQWEIPLEELSLWGTFQGRRFL
ncbi:hypothetical protein BDZ91DRAFT_366041 [Kalaharituber pfeilii]|nr:hypothetical protein BDZ91DRAFT_366041 [Kalaharituber pfeilii]